MFATTSKLKIAYEKTGEGRPVILLHGWPDDARTWDRVVPDLVEAGYQTICPWTRGYGKTEFIDDKTIRSGQVVALAQDLIEFLDALSLKDKVILVGHDWGARTAYVAAALWPERFQKIICLAGGYETGVKPGNHLPFEQARAYWYQWFWNTQQGEEMLRNDPRGACRFLWKHWAPNFDFSQEEFETTAKAWDNPDWVALTLHSYRVRWGNAAPDSDYAELEKRLNTHPVITVPTAVLHGEADGASLVGSSEGQESSFSSGYHRETFKKIGHFVQRENPSAVVKAILANPS